MSLAPGFLIAFPHLTDVNFRQSVVLLLQQDENGEVIIVNRCKSKPAQPGPREHGFGHDGARDKSGQYQGRKRKRCDNCVAKGMFPNYHLGGHAFSPGQLDVLGIQHVQHCRTDKT